MTTYSNAISVFLSYAHEDEPLRNEFVKHLRSLERQGLISTWFDRKIVPGTNWSEMIDERLDRASIILLLVSSDFLASEYCYQVEMKRALAREQAGQARAIPVILRPTDWNGAPFAHLQVLPTDAKAITTWGNRDEAFVDVVSGIRRAIEDLALLPATSTRATLPSIWNIPYPRNPFFMGRDEVLSQLHTQLQAGQTMALSQSPTAISGLGGIGKTQIATEYAYRYHQDYEAIMWTRAESRDALISSYIAIARLLKLPECDADEQEITIDAVKRWLQNHQKWLIILDNADELDVLPPFLPTVPGGHILLTTRAWDMQRLAMRLEVATLSDEQGAALLLRRAGILAPEADLTQACIEDRQLSISITHELGGLPLALDQAGAYLEATGMGMQEYQEIYQAHRQALLRERRSHIPDHPEPVATTWSLSFQKVEEKNPAAADLLRLCSFLSPDAIPEEILTAGASLLGSILAPVAADVFQRNQAFEALRAYSLIRRNPTEKTLSIHRLVQAVLQDTLKEEEKHIWGERAVLVVAAGFPHAEHGTWPQCERLLTQALVAIQWIERSQARSEQVARLLYETASYLKDRARYSETEPLYQRALRIREQQLGPDHPDVVYLLNSLAILYTEQGRYSEAEPLYQRVLHICEQQLGSDQPDAAVVFNNLAHLYTEQGKYSEAEPLYQRTLHIYEQQLGLSHPQVAIALNNLANLYVEQGRYSEAEPLYQSTLHIREQQLGPDHPDVAYPLNGLATLYYMQGKYSEVESLYQRALHIREQQLGLDHPGVATVLNGLASLYADQGKYSEAEPLYHRALCIREQQLGLDHPGVATVLNNLAIFYVEQGKYSEAEPLYLRVLGIEEQQLGLDHPDVAITLNNLASLYSKQGDHAEAVPLYQCALHIIEQSLGPEHPHTKMVRANYAKLLPWIEPHTCQDE
ncbi:FxSxx-COOH system tetratricopeptide repeat protein [Dictyobacter kobayashii]|uniref:Tetratricopeptide repeat protein n=1 Tax=Dictyobacter kobayashii TaxID=2014872 RepID=A0A402ABQ1_9CHLR|nr:FxSxx-COOH system tetratricopeptide repeat protein [Dictyobacter kobayashii]GCE16511.1 tetratricopeptide repeat protein [Dictyobacter kobayashii]